MSLHFVTIGQANRNGINYLLPCLQSGENFDLSFVLLSQCYKPCACYASVIYKYRRQLTGFNHRSERYSDSLFIACRKGYMPELTGM